MEIINSYLQKINEGKIFQYYTLKEIEEYFLKHKKELKETYKNNFLQIIKNEIISYFESFNPEKNTFNLDEETIEEKRKQYNFYKNIHSLSFAPIGIEYYDDDYEYISSCLSIYQKSEEYESEQLDLDDDNYDYFNSIVDFLNSRMREDVLYILFESSFKVTF